MGRHLRGFFAEHGGALLGISKNKVWKLARRPEDPLPLRRMPNQERGGIVFREELVAWAKRNFTRVGTN